MGRLWRTHPTRFFWLITGLICLSRLPYLIWLWPGVLSNDSMVQIRQALGVDPLTNNHPAAHTWLIGVFVRPADALGQVTWGIGAYSMAQIILTSAAMGYAIVKLMAWGTRRWLVVAVFSVLALFPVHGVYSIIMWKNVPFAAAMLVLAVMLIDL